MARRNLVSAPAERAGPRWPAPMPPSPREKPTEARKPEPHDPRSAEVLSGWRATVSCVGSGICA
ncbi:hypothetical protein CHLRE_07g349167v5 [Chlamydomonas reinhardtii]|uniref:Uncharacterized protein n=1 Tax=Chlamydomonas reinhardtii TaxID=3055 RepID=A0A2K3DL68_CHLRE|nr:uncharacterized protein CHLRE_07g349167v5 [Chlamydomonas reinhardtii]PNW81273.1 hypothetical protein CHLRE_07g349167v5 [Chlamydomonas reinhardtii]